MRALLFPFRPRTSFWSSTAGISGSGHQNLEFRSKLTTKSSGAIKQVAENSCLEFVHGNNVVKFCVLLVDYEEGSFTLLSPLYVFLFQCAEQHACMQIIWDARLQPSGAAST
jgi:hypothetical protein